MRNFSTKADNTAPLASGLLTAEEDNVRFNEMENAVTTAGISLDGASGPDTDQQMLAQAQARYASGGVMYQDSGAANTYVLASVGSFRLPQAYFKGMIVKFYPGASNTGASTVNVGGLGAKNILGPTGQALVAGDIVANTLCEMTYDTTSGGRFLLSPWSVLLANVTGGVALYEGREDGKHKIRSLEAGTNVTLDLIETSGGSGDYRVRISSTAGGGAGGGNPHVNVGGGAQVHARINAGNDELRSITAGTGITVTQNTNEIDVKLADIAAWTIWLRNAGTPGAPAATTIGALTEETTPAGNDWLMLAKNSTNILRKVSVTTLRGSGATAVATGFFSATTALATPPTINSQTISGATLAQVAGDPLRLRLTFDSALADANFVALLDFTSNVVGGVVTAIDKTTAKVDFFFSTSGTTTFTVQFVVFKV